MKAIYCSALFLLVAIFTAKSQIAPGNWILGGDGQVELVASNNQSDFGVVLSPSALYFTSDRFAVGGTLTVGLGGFGRDIFGLTPQARYYLDVQDRRAWYIGADLSFTTGDGQFLSGGAQLGLDLFLNSFVAWESALSVGFQRGIGDSFNNNTLTVVGFGTGLRFFLGPTEDDKMERGNILQKGTKMWGATSGTLAFSQIANSNNITLDLRPNYGQFLSDRFLLGGALGLLVTKFNNLNFTTFQFELTPFARYYFNSDNRRAIPFAELGAGISVFDLTGEGSDFEARTSSTVFAGIGFDVFLAPNVALEIKGSYRRFGNNTNFANIDVNRIAIDLGFQFFLNSALDE
ncbi:MAG: hypothetical protein AAF960_28855 [Bacteroidota bacterium]